VNIKAAERTQQRYDNIPDPVVRMKLLSAAQIAKLNARFIDESKPQPEPVESRRRMPDMPTPPTVASGGVKKGSRKKKQ
jgi:hypothetical protein